MKLLASVFALIALAVAMPVQAEEHPNQQNYDLLTDFIESDRKCANDTTMCARVDALCSYMTPTRVNELHRYMRNEYPFRTKNGAMHIPARFSRALRKCG